MAVLGLNINKMYIEKEKNVQSGVKINTNIKILKVEEAKVRQGETQREGALVSFEVKIDYDPEIAEILIAGQLIYSNEDEKKVAELISFWEKENKLPADPSLEIYNAILRKANIEALILAERMKLPVPFRMPRFKKAEEKEA